MVNLSVWIEIKGEDTLVGFIQGNNSSDACFAYDSNYMASSDAHPISLSLPFQKESFNAYQTKCYFDGLLPEGYTRRCIADNIHVVSDDYLSILTMLGSECLGAVKILEGVHTDMEAKYELLEKHILLDFAKEGASESVQLVTKSHLSLAGASGKAGLYYDSLTNKWYLPIGKASSTHIVKQSHVRLKRIVANEQLCLLTAKNLGIDVPESFIVSFDNINEEYVLFVSKRYDRLFSYKNKQINGLKIPYRLHQEDFAQAMGIPAFQKYEKPGDDYLKKMFALLRTYSSDPIHDQLRLWDICIFNYLIGNTDNHIKNISIIYDEVLSSIKLAPAYDMLSTIVYESSTDEMALGINNTFHINEISRTSFEKASKEIGLGTSVAMRHFDKLVSQFDNALENAALDLSEKGFLEAEDIASKIHVHFSKLTLH